MSELNAEEQVNEINELNEEIGKEPVPFSFFMPLVKALENRIDYNFNTIIQLSLLVEYLYEELEQKGIQIELDSKFNEFQETRLKEMKEEFLKKASEQEVESDEETKVDIDLDLEDS